MDSTYFVILHDETTGAEFLDEIRMKSVNLYHSLLDRYAKSVKEPS